MAIVPARSVATPRPRVSNMPRYTLETIIPHPHCSSGCWGVRLPLRRGLIHLLSGRRLGGPSWSGCCRVVAYCVTLSGGSTRKWHGAAAAGAVTFTSASSKCASGTRA